MLNIDELAQSLKISATKKLVIAFSGGLDSYVLLYAIAQISITTQDYQIRAIHIDHGLQAVSSQWSVQCEAICKVLNIPCEIISLNLLVPKSKSLEAAAREARYQAFKESLQTGETLLTAQHQDDQAETLLIQLFRGAGINGLAAMPALRNFGKGTHLRPLLNVSRESLEQYAKYHALNFIEDPSNQDQRFDRNYFRHEIIPHLKQRWPSMDKVLTRAAYHQAEAKNLLAEYIEQDLPLLAGSRVGTLSIKQLKLLSEARCKAVIRYFLDQKGFLAPSQKKLAHIITDVLNSQDDAMPCVHWQGIEVRRYQDDLHAITPLDKHDEKQCISWNISKPLYIPSLKRILKTTLLDDIKVLGMKKEQNIEIRFRQGGEKIYQAQRKRTIALKKYFQEMHIPPWERERTPLIYIDNQLVAIVFDGE